MFVPNVIVKSVCKPSGRSGQYLTPVSVTRSEYCGTLVTRTPKGTKNGFC